MFQKVYPSNYPELEPYKGIVKTELDEIFDFVDPYELWYYYFNGYVMRYVNNYYQYEKYDPRVFQKNMAKALHNWCSTEKEKVIDYVRKEVGVIDTVIGSYKPEVVISPSEYGIMSIIYTWVTVNTDACEKCKKLNGKRFINTKNLHSHWHCRCRIKQTIKVIDQKGNILEESEKIL